MKPSVVTKCVADAYADANERIVEFSAGGHSPTGGLIAFRRRDDETLMVQVYAATGPVEVTVQGHDGTFPAGEPAPTTRRAKAQEEDGIARCRVCGEDLGANDPHGPDCPVGRLEDLRAAARRALEAWDRGDEGRNLTEAMSDLRDEAEREEGTGA